MFLSAHSSTKVGHRYGLDIMHIDSFDKSLPLVSSNHFPPMALTTHETVCQYQGSMTYLAATSKLQKNKFQLVQFTLAIY
jgi:hypothetical protein